jgi:hypothetical protein
MYQTDGLRMVRRVLAVLIILLLCIFGYRIYATEQAIHASGILSVSAPAPGTSLTVTQAGHSAAYIGAGSARIRLKAGTYVVGATVSGERATKTVTISRAKTTTVHLNPAAPNTTSTAPTPTGFINFDTLVDSGLTADQESALEQEFTEFRPSAQVFSIDPQTISVTVPDPSSGSTVFTMNFDVTVDSTLYHANVQYTSYSYVQVKLTDTSGAQVYEGYPPVTET